MNRSSRLAIEKENALDRDLRFEICTMRYEISDPKSQMSNLEMESQVWNRKDDAPDGSRASNTLKFAAFDDPVDAIPSQYSDAACSLRGVASSGAFARPCPASHGLPIRRQTVPPASLAAWNNQALCENSSLFQEVRVWRLAVVEPSASEGVAAIAYKPRLLGFRFCGLRCRGQRYAKHDFRERVR